MREDDLLPHSVRILTNDGLRFLASYRGLLNFAEKVRDRGGPHTQRWDNAIESVTAAMEADDEPGAAAAIKKFSVAARYEGWAC